METVNADFCITNEEKDSVGFWFKSDCPYCGYTNTTSGVVRGETDPHGLYQISCDSCGKDYECEI